MKANDNRSLFLYTSLIFLVAIIMVILAFFGQSNMQKSQPIQTDSAYASTITQKAAQLSEDNRLLLEQKQALEIQLAEAQAENASIEYERDLYLKETENNNTLLEVYNLLYNGKKLKARNLLETIVSEELTPTQQKFYKVLVKKSK